MDLASDQLGKATKYLASAMPLPEAELDPESFYVAAQRMSIAAGYQ
jgi:hypothetical protein